MPQITLHIQPGFQVEGRPRSFSGTPFAVKIQRVLQYKKLAFQVAEVGWLERLEVLPKLSRSNKLPVLDYDGERIEDSSDIARFIEQRHPDPPLIPSDLLTAARCHFIEEWADDVLYWYGAYEQVRITEGNVVSRAYYRDPSGRHPAQARRVRCERGREGPGRSGSRPATPADGWDQPVAGEPDRGETAPGDLAGASGRVDRGLLRLDGTGLGAARPAPSSFCEPLARLSWFSMALRRGLPYGLTKLV